MPTTPGPFAPIAIVGRACTLPLALSPEALWQNIRDRRVCVSRVPEGRWGLEPSLALADKGAAHARDRSWADVGGYVRGFEDIFDPTGFSLDPAHVVALDPVFQWTLHTVREALRSAGIDGAAARAGLVLGNLSFPSAGMARFAEQTWLRGQAGLAAAAPVHPHNRFSSGLPALLTASALGLGAGAFALDAACASSLYAIKLACDRLHDRLADVVVAGAVNSADDLFIHVGFSALSALSKTGQSRPFHAEADGLVPAEGAAFVVLERLDDAIANGHRILGVIRGVGLSNDGRGRGLLAPAEEGQERAMRAAYACAGLSPKDITLLECHATGTPVGDGTEVRSSSQVFAERDELTVGSLKSNLGHLITAAGTAGLLKVLAAMEARVKPASLHAEVLNPALAGTPLRVLREEEAWTGPRRAGVSAFGFGGNNAHLIVEAWEGERPEPAPVSAASAPRRREPVAIVGVGARVGAGESLRDLAATLFSGVPATQARTDVAVSLDGIRFPPRDLTQTLPQQLAVLEAAREATKDLVLPRDRTAVLVGMGCDPEVARYGARWRVAAWAKGSGSADEAWIEAARAAFVPVLESAGVVGTMPNIVANRINSQLDLAGPSFSVSAEEASGTEALIIAARALQAGEIDAAVVGAVDLSHEAVHQAALGAIGDSRSPGDAAVVLVVKRLADARREGDEIFAILDGTAPVDGALALGDGPAATSLAGHFGRPHAASGLLHVASAALALRHGARLRDHGTAAPWLGQRVATVTTRALGASVDQVLQLRGTDTPAAYAEGAAPTFSVYAGADRAAVLAELAAGREGGDGDARLVLAWSNETERAQRIESARTWLERGGNARGPQPEGVAFAEGALGRTGELAFVFGGAAAAYPGMGRDLLLAVPALAESLAARSTGMEGMVGWAFADDDAPPAHPLDQLWGASFLAQIHAELSRTVLALSPRAAIGYSSGESNALFALGAWTDLDAMVQATHHSPLFRTDLTGELAAVRRVWSRAGEPGTQWAAYAISAPLAEVNAALADEAHAHLTIVNSPDDCVVGGEASAVARVVERLGAARAARLDYDLAAHTPEIAEVRAAWWALHHRATSPVPGVRFYSAGRADAYAPTPESAADAITAQALGTLDFPALIERAYADGVRVFVEHGPRGACTRSIQRILGDRPHLAVALDREGRGALAQIVNAVCDLLAAGVSVDAAALSRAIGAGCVIASSSSSSSSSSMEVRVPAHRPFPRLPAPVVPAKPVVSMNSSTTQSMVQAPVLPSVMDAFVQPPPAVSSAPAKAPPPAPAPRPQTATAPPAFVAQATTAPLATTATYAPAPVAASSASFVSSEASSFGASAATAEVLARLSAHRAHVARVHQDYLASQAAVHEQFLALRQRAEASLLDGFRAAMQGGPQLALATSAEVVESAPWQAQAPVAVASEPMAASYVSPPPSLAPASVASVASVSSVVAPVAPPKPAPVAIAKPAAKPAPAASSAVALPGPKYDRRQLEILASGAISSVFGPLFAGQDSYHRQVRMPEPPLLLADRVTGIDAVPQSMGTGTIWTETDVQKDSWYLDRTGRMPAGIMIESGQADLLLISWLGADTLNQSDRVYRLLGCELTYHGSLPKPGDTLAYDIHVDGHAAQGPVRLFFFHYDCHIGGRPALSVRGGQAGFFTDEELADSAGVLWDAAQETPKQGPLDPPHTACAKRSLTREEVRAFADGKPFACFGKGWERTQAHVRTPGITSGRRLFLDEVTVLDLQGGPWGRGYLRAETAISPDDWFFEGHFKNDPCMPGTLMFDGCLQAMAVAMTAMGFSIERDGWRFEPVPEEKYLLRCRGQVTPASKHLTYEVFFSEIVAGPIPMLFADLLCTVDGRKAFHAKRVGLRLVPDWPLSHWRELGPAKVQETGEPLALREQGGLLGYRDPEAVAVVDGFRFGYDSLIACAWGPPSEAFGPFYSRFDGHRKVARLPGPPYHFMSRVTDIQGVIGSMKTGIKTEIAYDVPGAVWYFEQNASPTMPFCVLLEAALQPCGWLASFVGSANTSDIDLLFRNLDGTGTLHAEILPGQTLRTRVEITGISASAGMIIESFNVSCLVEDKVVYDMTTVFGFFPKEAFDDQVGLPVSDDERARMSLPAEPSTIVDLECQPAAYCSGTLRLPAPMLLMIDRVTANDRTGGKKGLGFLRAEKTVDVDEWFFKAHFFQDPVQPGSLGIEAIVQLLQFAMLDRGMGEGMKNPRFEPLMLGRPLTWKYRGQVVPKNELIQSEIEIIEIGEDEKGRFVICDGFLWVDGKRIYGAKNLGMRIVEGPAPSTPGPKKHVLAAVTGEGQTSSAGHPGTTKAAPGEPVVESLLDPALDAWLLDHRPTWTAPALPMMSMVDRLVAAVEHAAGEPVAALESVRAHRWLPLPESAGPVRLRTEVSPVSQEAPHRRAVTLSAWREAADPALSRFEPVASAEAILGAPKDAPSALDPLAEAQLADDPYESGALFHGPAFRYLERLRLGPTGSSAILRADGGTVPRGALHQGLLDAATHGIPHDQLAQWSADIAADVVGYPYRISRVDFFGALPDAGEIRVEARFAGFDGDARFPVIELQIIASGRVCVALRLVEILLPKGPLGSAALADRRAFLRDRRFVPEVSLSTHEAGTSRLHDAVVQQSDWLAGTTASVYGLSGARGSDPVAEIALREHVARAAYVHPSALDVDADLGGARARIRPLRHHATTVQRAAGGEHVEVRDLGPARQDLSVVKTYWDKRFGIGPWPVEDLYYGLIDRFVGDVILTDPDAFAAIHGRSSLYLGNHQVGVESLLFSILASALSGTPTVTLAKAEHRTSWLGRLIAHSFSYPDVQDPNVITFFDRDDRESLVRIVSEISEAMATTGKSAMVHVEGTRALAANRPVIKMSSVFLDMALAVRAPVIPVRFTSALPVAELTERLEFPLGYGKQDIWIGRPILPEELEAIPYKDRKPFVIAAMNGLGPQHEEPSAPDPEFAHSVARYRAETGADAEHAVLFQTLAHLAHPGEGVRALLEGARSGELVTDGSPRGEWLAELAERLYGTHGPRVRR